MRLRHATHADAARLLEWRNDPLTRQASFSAAPVAEADHVRWLNDRLTDPSTRLWIAEHDGIPVGQVRVESTGIGEAEVHIAVAPGARGHGHASVMLDAAVEAAADELGAVRVVGRVKAANAASRRAFERAAFVAEDEHADPLRYVRAISGGSGRLARPGAAWPPPGSAA